MRLKRPPDLATLRALWWTHRSLREVRAALAVGGVQEIELTAPPPLPDSAIRGVEALLRRREHTCLEAALVRQRWHAAQGEPREIVIGVRSPTDDFLAHAWLAGDDDPQASAFTELARLKP